MNLGNFFFALVLGIFFYGSYYLCGRDGDYTSLIKYHSYIAEWCCRGGVIQTGVFVDYHAITETSLVLNQLLPDEYKIKKEDFDYYYSIYKRYQLWLYRCYVKLALPTVCRKFNIFFSFRNRKRFHVNALSSYFGVYLKQNVFFLETFCAFVSEREYDNKICGEDFFLPTPHDTYTLSEFGVVAYKIRLATIIAEQIIGVDHGDSTESIKVEIDKSIS